MSTCAIVVVLGIGFSIVVSHVVLYRLFYKGRLVVLVVKLALNR